MQAVRVAPSQRMDRLEFGTEREVLDHIIEVGAYRCPHCTTEVAFRSSHFGPRPSPISQVDAKWARAFDRLRPLDLRAWESFVDFPCPGCKAPVRLVYGAGDTWAMGTNSWRVADILEVHPWQAGAVAGAV
jgi:predicted RNA-binding Zn-ribbon protein involved in translation (DUF1610 family)